MKNTIGFLSAALVVLGALAAQAASTCHNYNWTNSLGDGNFSDDGNWTTETYSAPAAKEAWQFPHDASGGLVYLTEDFAKPQQSNYFTFTNGVGLATTTLDLKGHTLDLGIRWLHGDFQNGSPIVMSNGTFLATASNQRYGRYGRTDDQLVEVLFKDMVVRHSAFSAAHGPTSVGPHAFTFVDSVVTNFPSYVGTLSDSELTYDNSSCYVDTQMSFAPSATNATIRLVNNTVWTTGNSAQYWIKTNPGNVNCRVVMTSGASSNTQKYYLDGTNNVLALTNVVSKMVYVGGKSNFADLHSVSANYGVNVEGFVMEGEDGTIRLSGDLSEFKLTPMHFYITPARDPLRTSVRSRFEFADNTTMTSEVMQVHFGLADSPTFYLGTNCFVNVAGLLMNANPAGSSACWNGFDSTNALVYVGNGSVLQKVGIGFNGKGAGSFSGYNAKLTLDNGKYRYTGFKGGQAVYCGVTIELLGDESEFFIGYQASTDGPLYLGLDAGDHGMGTVFKFRPGPLAYHGVPPVGMKTVGSSTMSDKVSIKVDLSDYIPSQTTRRHVIPLIKGNPSKWAEPKPDLQHLTDTLTIERANDRVSNARIVYDADLDAISLAFDLNFGLMILVR